MTIEYELEESQKGEKFRISVAASLVEGGFGTASVNYDEDDHSLQIDPGEESSEQVEEYLSETLGQL